MSAPAELAPPVESSASSGEGSVGGASPDLEATAAAGRGIATSAASFAEFPGALTTAVVGR